MSRTRHAAVFVALAVGCVLMWSTNASATDSYYWAVLAPGDTTVSSVGPLAAGDSGTDGGPLTWNAPTGTQFYGFGFTGLSASASTTQSVGGMAAGFVGYGGSETSTVDFPDANDCVITHDTHQWVASSLSWADAGTGSGDLAQCDLTQGAYEVVATSPGDEVDTDDSSSDPASDFATLALKAWCQASSCSSLDSASADVTNLIGGFDDPQAYPTLTIGGTLWQASGTWVSSHAPPAGGWGLTAQGDDPAGVCELEAFLTPHAEGQAQAVLSDTSQNVTPTPASITDPDISPLFASPTPCGGTPRSLSWPIDLSSVPNGSYDLVVESTNPGGTIEDRTVMVDVDNDPPPQVTGLTATTSAMGPAGWSSTPVFNLSWTNPPDVSGPQSPIDQAVVQQCEPDGSGCTNTQITGPPASATVTLTAGTDAGDYQGWVWDVDQADNQGTPAPVDLPYDPTAPSAPTMTPGWSGPIGQAQAATIPEDLHSTAGPSQVYGYQVTVDSQPTGGWQNVNSTGAYDLSTLTDGLHTLYARALSGAGVASPVSETSIDLEQNGPSVTVAPSPTIPPDDQVTTPETFTLACVDRTDPGCKSITYTIDGGAPVTVTGPGATVTVSGDGQHTLTAYSTDQAGNESQATTVTFTIATPGTPQPANPPSVFTVAPAPTITDTIPVSSPPIAVSGLINGTYITTQTKVLTLTPTLPAGQVLGTLTVTWSQGPTIIQVETVRCVTTCTVRVPIKKLKGGRTKLTAKVRTKSGERVADTTRVLVDKSKPVIADVSSPFGYGMTIDGGQVLARAVTASASEPAVDGYAPGVSGILITPAGGQTTLTHCTTLCSTVLYAPPGLLAGTYKIQTVDKAGVKSAPIIKTYSYASCGSLSWSLDFESCIDTPPSLADTQAKTIAALAAAMVAEALEECVKKGACKLDNSNDENPASGWDCHHVVPKTDRPSIADAQSALRNVGIEIRTDPRNLIKLTRGFHYFVHNGLYFSLVEDTLRPGYLLSVNDATRLEALQAVEEGLESLKVDLTNADNVLRGLAGLDEVPVEARDCASRGS